MSTCREKISLAHALGAREIIRPYLSPTPLRQYASLNRHIGAKVYVKHENHNPTGTFKIRGGITLMHHLVNNGVSGVITYSTGNHGASVATSARMFGLTAVVVVVSENSNPLKVQTIKDAGAEMVEYGKDFEAAGRKVAQLVEERGLYFVHPANEPHLINGVGTEFLESIEMVPDLDVMIVPIGAGSEAAAAITVLKQIRPEIEIIATQAEASQVACMSWKAGEIVTAPRTRKTAGTIAITLAKDECSVERVFSLRF